MAKFSLKLTKRYLRDLKLARKRGMDESLLNGIIGKLLNDEPLPAKNHDHQLHGDYEGYRECQGHRHQDYLTIADRHALRPVQQEEQTESKMSG